MPGRTCCCRPARPGKVELDDLVEEFDGQLDEDAGGVTAVGSAPRRRDVPRCSRATSRRRRWVEARPWMSVTMATPQESDSFCGSYKPL